MDKRERKFNTPTEATAFLEGIEFVADHTIEAWIEDEDPLTVHTKDTAGDDIDGEDDDHWDGLDPDQALEEGWFICDVDSTGWLEIEKDHESDVFDGDDAALVFVKAQAAAGSQYHAKALFICMTAQRSFPEGHP